MTPIPLSPFALPRALVARRNANHGAAATCFQTHDAGLSPACSCIYTSPLSTGTLQLRDGAFHAMNTAAAAGIPFLVFSAGLADVIELALKHAAPSSPGRGDALAAPGASAAEEGGGARRASAVTIVSNKMQWSADSAGGADAVLTGFSEPLIHMFNKNQSQVPADEQPGRCVMCSPPPRPCTSSTFEYLVNCSSCARGQGMHMVRLHA